MTALVKWNDRQLSLIRKTVAKDCTPTEFDWFVEICRGFGLDPLRRQIYAFVFHADKADKRQLIPVVSIGGLRAIAERTGNYRPDDKPTRFEFTEPEAATNPHGLLRAEVAVYKRAHGEWFPVVAEAYWSEFAPLKEIWENDKPTGKFRLDHKKEGWHRMPRLMLAKCAEALALRKAWPDDFAGVYEESEIDRAHSIDLTPSEMADAGDQDKRMEMIGGKSAILVDWMDGEPLQRVPAGKFGDASLAFIREHMKPGEEEVSAVLMWRDKNRHALTEYWALDKDGALTLKAELEKVEAKLKEAA
jgi:phage recombination protein Bet